jgi:hypothetical protein
MTRFDLAKGSHQMVSGFNFVLLCRENICILAAKRIHMGEIRQNGTKWYFLKFKAELR